MLEGQTEDDDLWATKRPVVFPNLHLTSGGGRHTFGWRVPLDDTHTMEVFVRVFDPGSGVNVPRQEVVPWIEVPVVDANGQFSAAWHSARSGRDGLGFPGRHYRSVR